MNISSIRAQSTQSHGLPVQAKSPKAAGTSQKQGGPEFTFEDFQNLANAATASQPGATGNGSSLPNPIQADIKSGKLQPPPPPSFGPNGGGADIPEELKAHDTNGDGLFSADELKSILSDIQSGKLQPPKPPGGQGQGASSTTGGLTDEVLQKLLKAFNTHHKNEGEQTDGSPQISSSLQLANQGYSLSSSDSV